MTTNETTNDKEMVTAFCEKCNLSFETEKDYLGWLDYYEFPIFCPECEAQDCAKGISASEEWADGPV